MRTWDFIKDMTDTGHRFGFFDDPDNRWIIDIGRRDLGTLIIYSTDTNNVATGEGHVRFGFQDNVRDLTDRYPSREVLFDEPLDLNSKVCGC